MFTKRANRGEITVFPEDFGLPKREKMFAVCSLLHTVSSAARRLGEREAGCSVRCAARVVNFLLHHHLARAAHESLFAGIGAMLPDLWRMADRRVRVIAPTNEAWSAIDPEDHAAREVMRGIDHHLVVDEEFHKGDVFTLGERRTAVALRNAGVSAKKLVLFAHPLWEMCLDGALVRKLGAEELRTAIAQGFERARGATHTALSAHYLRRVSAPMERADGLVSRMDWIAEELSKGPWIEGYAHADGLVRGLSGLRRRLGLPPLSEEDRARLARSIATLEDGADRTLGEILKRSWGRSEGGVR